MAQVVFKYGTRAQYDALTEKLPNALYFLTDTGEIYRGSVNLARGNHYEGERATGETDAQVITRVLGEQPALKDDIFVIKTVIADDKMSYISFIYDGENWKAMDGNYDAENVYFDQDLTFTHEVGYVKPDNGSALVPAKGKNVKELLEYMFSKEEDPKITLPTVGITAPKNTAYEVGTKVSPTYTVGFDNGLYSYGPATEITATFNVTDTNGGAKTTSTGTFDELTVADNTNYKISVVASYTEGAVPVSNLGNEKPDLAIAAGTTSKTSGALTGFRNFFYGVVNTATVDAPVSSALVRGLTAGGAYAGSKTLSVSAVAGAKRVIVAVPASSSRAGITKVIMPSAMNAEVTSQFVLQGANVEIEGANGFTAVPYKVWIYEPAALDPTEKYTITLG